MNQYTYVIQPNHKRYICRALLLPDIDQCRLLSYKRVVSIADMVNVVVQEVFNILLPY